jgi:hypothetical protein
MIPKSLVLLVVTDLISTEICEDVKEECEKYGKVLDMKVPRPTGGSRQSNGVGKIFVKFDTPESAGKALRALAGRKFADRTVVTTYFSEVRIILSPYEKPANISYRKTLRWLHGKRKCWLQSITPNFLSNLLTPKALQCKVANLYLCNSS